MGCRTNFLVVGMDEEMLSLTSEFIRQLFDPELEIKEASCLVVCKLSAEGMSFLNSYS